MKKIACVAVVKNEARHIAEWLAFQFAIGFDTVILMDNSSTDDTIPRALDFAEHHDIRIVDWPATNAHYQTAAYEHALRRGRDEFTWMAFFDTDEFLVLDAGIKLKPLLEARTDAAAIGVSWAIFGSSGHREIPAGLVIEDFCRRSSLELADNRHVKSIVRPDRTRSCLNPHAFDIDGSYKDLRGMDLTWSAPGILAQTPDYALGKLHHYFTRSHAHWLEKLRRGYHDTKRDEADFNRLDRNDLFDDSATRYAPAIKQLMTGRPMPVPLVHGFALVACARWEATYVVEWLTYHRWLGFDHVFLYCNDDDPAELYEKVLPFIVGDTPFVTFHHHRPQGQQAEMYRHFLRTYKASTRWFMFLDIDEFLVLKRHRNVQDFMEKFLHSADQVVFNWLPYGTSWYDTPAPGSVLLNYTRREPHLHPMTKYLARAAAVPGEMMDVSFWHNFGPKLSAGLRMTNPIGLNMGGYDFASGKQNVGAYSVNPATGESLLDIAYIAHFPFKSRLGFLRRVERGLQGDFAVQTIWRDMYNSPNFEGYLRHINEVEDLTLRTLWWDVLALAQRPPVALSLPPAALPPAPTAGPKLDFSYSKNPLGQQGFVIGWEEALLGNRLSSFANLFALSHRTSIPTMYPQIMSVAALLDVETQPEFFLQGALEPGHAPALASTLAPLFDAGYDKYEAEHFTLPLEALSRLKTETGIVVYTRYRSSFQDLGQLEPHIKDFCGRGNGIILPGAYWPQYQDMRDLASCGRRLKEKLRLNRDDHRADRAAAMRNANAGTLRIGIHIRQGDYRNWHAGRYCFETEKYLGLMWHLHLSLEQPHQFCVCSDQPLEPRLFQGLPVLYERGAQEDDFVALSRCHYVIGPPSTFGTWSAFIGGAKRVVLTPERMADLQAWSPLLNHAVEIIYPTGGYLPDDPAAAPI